jgi:TIR domain
MQRLQSDLVDLQRKVSEAARKASDCSGKLARLLARKPNSASAQQSNLRDIASLQAEHARHIRVQADLGKKVAAKTRELHRSQGDLRKEEEHTRRVIADAARRRRAERESYNRKLASSLQLSSMATVPSKSSPTTNLEMQHDFFISHASEDKDEFVRPLVERLRELGLSVWYDEFQLRVGDSLRRSIDRGLSSSRYGVVVLSSAFFAKNWPQYELDGLVAKEIAGSKVVLPIWHKVTKDEVMSQSPSLADKVALNTAIHSLAQIADELTSIARPQSVA